MGQTLAAFLLQWWHILLGARGPPQTLIPPPDTLLGDPLLVRE